MTQKRRTVQVTGVEMDIRIVPVPAERVEVWRSGVARMYDALDAMIEKDRDEVPVMEVK